MSQRERLGKYEIVEVLGRGAMGIVFKGFDPGIDRTVALKTIRKELIEDDDRAGMALARFRNEARAAGRLSHPGIVAVYDYGESESVSYIAMEYVQGNSLREYFNRGTRFGEADTVSIMAQLLEALQHAHDAGVWHRDIKPANLIIMGNGRLKIADFGIARIEASQLVPHPGPTTDRPRDRGSANDRPGFEGTTELDVVVGQGRRVRQPSAELEEVDHSLVDREVQVGMSTPLPQLERLFELVPTDGQIDRVHRRKVDQQNYPGTHVFSSRRERQAICEDGTCVLLFGAHPPRQRQELDRGLDPQVCRGVEGGGAARLGLEGDGANQCVCLDAPHEDGVQGSFDGQVGDVPALPGDQPGVLEPAHGATDQRLIPAMRSR